MGRELEQRALTARFQKLLGRLQDGECLSLAALAEVFGTERIYPLFFVMDLAKISSTNIGTHPYGWPPRNVPSVQRLIVRRFQCAAPACAARWTYTGPTEPNRLAVCECGGRLIPAEPAPAAHPAEGWGATWPACGLFTKESPDGK